MLLFLGLGPLIDGKKMVLPLPRHRSVVVAGAKAMSCVPPMKIKGRLTQARGKNYMLV